MNKEKISSQELIDLIAENASVSKRVAEEFLKVMITTVEEALLVGETVKIKNFGTFKLQWNEPRKSVNVQTGEDIIIDGYYKTTFVPDVNLKNLVNEPFAHLEPVRIDEEDEQSEKTNSEEIPEPLKIFSEQASEIKNLLSEINALSNEAKESEEIIEIEDDLKDNADYDLDIVETEIKSINIESEQIDDLQIKNSQTVPVVELEQDNDNTFQAQIANEKLAEKVEDAESTINDNKIENADSEELLPIAKPSKKRNKWFLPIILLVLIALPVVTYFVCPPANEAGHKTFIKIEEKLVDLKANIRTTDVYNNTKKWFSSIFTSTPKTETIVIPKDTIKVDSISSLQPDIDSLQILFDTPRVYPEFIATAKLTTGSRLAWMSKRYYGLSDFWVYIYEANRDRFEDPDRIPAGALIYIPKLDSRLIDASNPRCINKARELHDLYVKTKK